ncbi:hypothetical protein Tco_0830906 [Tanacetum coccineum]
MSASQEEIPPPPPPPPSSQTPTQQTPHTKEDFKALVTIDGEGVDWTNHSEDEDYALMACNSSGSDTETQPSKSKSQSSDFDTCESNISTEPSKLVSELVVNESNVECQPKVWSDAPIIEEYDLNHLIRDCDFHEKRMARKAELNNGWNNVKRGWNDVQRVNKQNQFVPSSVLTRTVLTSTAMKVNTVKPFVNRVRPANVFYKTHSSSRPFKKPTVLRIDFSKQKVNAAKVNAVSTVGGKRETAVKPSAGCNWRPQRYHGGSKYNGGSSLRNCYTFKDPLGRLKPKQAWAHGLGIRPYLAEFKILMVAMLLWCNVMVYITGKDSFLPTLLGEADTDYKFYKNLLAAHCDHLNTIEHWAEFARKILE